MVGAGVNDGHCEHRQQQNMVPVHPSEQFLSGRMRQDISRMEKRGEEVLVPIFMVMMWSQERKELAIGFPDIISSGDEDWDVVTML